MANKRRPKPKKKSGHPLPPRIAMPAVQLTPESEAALVNLRRALARRGGTVYYVFPDGSARAEVLRRLRAWSGSQGLPALEVIENNAKAAETLEKMRASAPLPNGLVMANPGLVLTAPEEPSRLAEWNAARDLIGHRVGGPVLFVVDLEHLGKMPRFAPDLYDVRSGGYIVESVVAPLLVQPARARVPVEGAEAKKAALRERMARLTAQENDPDFPRGDLSRAWLDVANQWLLLDDYAESRDAAERARTLAETAEYEKGAADAWFTLGRADFGDYRAESASSALRHAQGIYQRIGDAGGEAACLLCLGDIALRRSQSDEARGYYERAMPIYQRIGNVLGEANCLRSLGDIARERSRHDEARAYFERAMPMYQRIGNVQGEANCLWSLGEIALRRSQHDAARGYLEQAMNLYAKIPDPSSMGWTHVRLAQASAGASDQEKHLRAAREAWASIGRQDLIAALDALVASGPASV